MHLYHFLHWRVARLVGRVLAWLLPRRGTPHDVLPFLFGQIHQQVSPDVLQQMTDKPRPPAPENEGLAEIQHRLQTARTQQSEQEATCWEDVLKSARRRSVHETSRGDNLPKLDV